MAVLKNRKDNALMDQSMYVGLFGQASAQFVNNNMAGMTFADLKMRSKKNGSTVVLEMARLGFTGTVAPWVTAYAELGFNAFDGSNIELSNAYVVMGDMDMYPVYAAIGSTWVPFGHFDTLAGVGMSMQAAFFQKHTQNLTVGYCDQGFGVTVSAYRGGDHDQNLSWNANKSEINGFVASASYTDTYANGDWYVGLSWANMSPFDFSVPAGTPVYGKKNGLWDVNAGITYDDFSFRGEYVATDKKWPATQQKVESYEFEASYDFNFVEYDHRFALGYGDIKWTKAGAPATYVANTPKDLRHTEVWKAALVSSLHENLSAFISWDHVKGPRVLTAWLVDPTPNVPVTPSAGATKALKTDLYKVGVQLSF